MCMYGGMRSTYIGSAHDQIDPERWLKRHLQADDDVMPKNCFENFSSSRPARFAN
jgi:hypothetical protein